MAAIIHIDMNSFFASCEQVANPFIAHKPVAVGNPSYKNTALVAASYEAKAFGIKAFMRGVEARQLCPQLIIVPADFLKYYSINRQIMGILREYTPEVEVYSIDEAFLDLTSVLHLYNKTPAQIAQEIKDRIQNEVGERLTSSVGVAPNKLLAKVASDWKKPDGLTVIEWQDRFEFLDQIPLIDIWGIGGRSVSKLERMGLTSTKQIREMPDQMLRSLVGSYYTRLKLIAGGEWYDPVNPGLSTRPHKSMQHAHTLGKPTNDIQELLSLIRKQSERLARRMRRHRQVAASVWLGLRPEKQRHYGWGIAPQFSGMHKMPTPNASGAEIYQAARRILAQMDLSQTKIRLIAVGIHDLQTTDKLRLDLDNTAKRDKLDQVADSINETYGEFTLRSGDIVYQYAKETELSVDKEDMVFHPD